MKKHILGQSVYNSQDETITFSHFCKKYLPHYFNKPMAEYQQVILDIINDRKIKSSHIKKMKDYTTIPLKSSKVKAIIDVEPRGFGKSTRLSFAYPLYCLVTQRAKFIVIFAATQNIAHMILSDIKDELEENKLLIQDFKIKKGKIWRNNYLQLSNGTAIISSGSGAAIRGIKNKHNRPDLIICDDLFSDQNSVRSQYRDKLFSWFMRSVVPLGQNAFIIVVATLFHHDDLSSRLLKRIEQGNLKHWLGLSFSALINEETSLWPDYWSVKKLHEKRQEIGSHAFACEYMNKPYDSQDQIFQKTWLKTYDHPPHLHDLYIVMGIDPSAGKHDHSAIVTLGRRSDGIIFVLDEWSQKCSADQLIKKIIEKYLIFKPKEIGFEEIGFQSIYRDHIIKEAARRQLYLPIKGKKPGRMGKERIVKLSPLIENGLLLFPNLDTPLVQQLLDYPHGTYDDLNDALYYAFTCIDHSNAPVLYCASTPKKPQYFWH